MNEDQIAARVRQNLVGPQDDPVVSDGPPPAVPGPDEALETGYTADLGDATDMYKLYDFYSIESFNRNAETEQKIQTIYRWAASVAGSTDYLAVANVLVRYQQGMPKGFSEQTLLDKMYSFVKLQSRIDAMKQEQDILYAT